MIKYVGKSHRQFREIILILFSIKLQAKVLQKILSKKYVKKLTMKFKNFIKLTI